MNIPGVVKVKTSPVRHEPQVEIVEVVELPQPEVPEVPEVPKVVALVKENGLVVYGQKYASDGLTIEWRPAGTVL
jgi:hypothetical protein